MRNLYAAEGPAFQPRQLTSGGDTYKYDLAWSPDGKKLLWSDKKLRLQYVDVDTKRVTQVARARAFEMHDYVWSPDSKWIAYMPVGQKSFRNVSVARVEGDGKGQPVSFLANTGSDTVTWSPDGTFILFDTGQRTEVGQLARIDLVPRTPKFREDQFRDLFKEETPKNVTPTLRRQENNPQSPVPPNETPGAIVTIVFAAFHSRETCLYGLVT